MQLLHHLRVLRLRFLLLDPQLLKEDVPRVIRAFVFPANGPFCFRNAFSDIDWILLGLSAPYAAVTMARRKAACVMPSLARNARILRRTVSQVLQMGTTPLSSSSSSAETEETSRSSAAASLRASLAALAVSLGVGALVFFAAGGMVVGMGLMDLRFLLGSGAGAGWEGGVSIGTFARLA